MRASDLGKIMASASGIGKAYHAIISLYYGCSYYYYCLYVYPPLNSSDMRPEERQFGGDAKFLTMWCLFFQMFYFFFSFFTDVVDLVTRDNKSSVTKYLIAIRDWFLCAVAFPIALVVVSMFWSLWSIDRQLVFPKELDEYFPMWLNHVLHTYLLPILVVDMWIVKHKCPPRVFGLLGLFTVAALYLVWILFLGFVKEIWVYPVLRVLNGAHFALFVVFVTVFPVPLYFFGERLISFMNGERNRDI
ncbi:androgen-induced gene 1 protein-like [Diadema setosum]|uniref:androgen-induced gene 1 protein-like n=1 Tax=Diadema setosum TaxID=31175 RepID=UPI003B3AB3FE